MYVFMCKDNKGILPPKDLTKSRTVKIGEDEDGEARYQSRPWYYFLDGRKVLKKYRIGEYLEVVED